jgi:hypothetical protein
LQPPNLQYCSFALPAVDAGVWKLDSLYTVGELQLPLLRPLCDRPLPALLHRLLLGMTAHLRRMFLEDARTREWSGLSNSIGTRRCTQPNPAANQWWGGVFWLAFPLVADVLPAFTDLLCGFFCRSAASRRQGGKDGWRSGVSDGCRAISDRGDRPGVNLGWGSHQLGDCGLNRRLRAYEGGCRREVTTAAVATKRAQGTWLC